MGMSLIESIGQSLIYGILVGALYGLAASGLSLVFGVMSYLNVAHGALLMIGTYVTYSLFSTFQLDPFLSIPVVMIMSYRGEFGEKNWWGIPHGTTSIVLRPARRPANHFRHQVLESRRGNFMVRFIHAWV